MSGGSPKSTTQTVIQEIPEWAKPYYKGIASRGRSESGKLYKPYGGERVAGFTSPERRAFRAAEGIYAAGPREELDWSYGRTQRAADIGNRPGLWSSKAYEQYANPYTENVLDLGRDRLLEGYREAMPQAIRSAKEPFYEAGIVGGRQNVMGARAAGEVSDAFAKNLREYEAEGLASAYDAAQESFRADRDARQAGADLQLRAASQAQNLASAQQSQAFERINALQSAGLSQREMNQAIRDIAYQDFLQKQNYQKDQLNWYAALLSGTPYNVTNQSTVSTQPGASPISQGVGLATAGLGAYKMFNS
tara:strand:+ start:4676 stop:5593 length:918 start_codon:yes stop_codon:yes gene_type:complete